MHSTDGIPNELIGEAIGTRDTRLAELHRCYTDTLAECERLRCQVEKAALSRQAQQAANLDALLTMMGKLLFALPQVDGGAIHLLKESGNALASVHLVLPEEFKCIESSYRGFLYPLSQPDVNVQVFQSGQAALVTADNAASFGDSTRLRFERMKMRRLLVVPLILQRGDGERQMLGVISLFAQHDLLDRALCAQIDEMAAVFAPFIQTHWMLHQAQERSASVELMYARIQQFIAGITEMNSRTALEDVYDLISGEFIEHFGFDMIDLMLVEGDQIGSAHFAFSEAYSHLRAAWTAFTAATPYALDAHDGLSAMVYLNNKHILVEDALQIRHLPMSDKDRASLLALGTPRTCLLMPIRFGDNPIGVMLLVSLGEPMAVPESEKTLIELLASFISTAIRNAQAHNRVEQQNREIELLNETLRGKVLLLDQVARKDRLTGLNNFGNFEEELKRRASEYERASGDGTLSMILLDVDHFKRFNDTYGHPAGNMVLQEVATRIFKCSREMDFVARYGGEEFAVILPQCDLDFAMSIAERMRAAVGEEFVVVDGVAHSITISGGCAQYLAHESYRDFLCRVDQTLYVAKHNGRNRIERAV